MLKISGLPRFTHPEPVARVGAITASRAVCAQVASYLAALKKFAHSFCVKSGRSSRMAFHGLRVTRMGRPFRAETIRNFESYKTRP